ncbi:MAG: FkbM family methyltransferase [Flavobacteriales bacterium]|nr:FkbM family methyltransferase [Flavobacteriales bacterium]
MLLSWLVRLARKKALQPLHIRLHRAAKVGMNYWGGAEVAGSGERWALGRAAGSLRNVEHPVVFDVGANNGEFTKAALVAFQRAVLVHAFEPSPTAAKTFLETVGKVPSVRLHRFGFSDEAGVAMLHSPTSGSSIATLHATTFEMQGRALVVDRIELRTVDGFCQEQGIERIHYLKVDTEGHELSVLKGAHEMIERGKVDFIQFEFGECHLDSRVFFRDVFTFLSPRYLIHRILPDGIWPLPTYSPDLEVFHTANYLGIKR